MSYKNKEKQREWGRKNYRKNKNKILERQKKLGKKYYYANREEILNKRSINRKPLTEEQKEKQRKNAKAYEERNRERRKEMHKEWNEKHRDKKRASDARRADKRKKYREENKEKIREYYRNKYHNDPIYKIKRNVSNNFKQAMVFYSKNGKTQSLKKYGIDMDAIVEHLGQLPQDGKKYDIDHIFPITAFDLNNPEHIRICWHPNNLQWLEHLENVSKSDNYDEKKFKEYLSENLRK